MRKWIIPAGSTAGAAGLRLIEASSPEPGPGEVKIAVKACSTNYRDFGVAAGKYFFGPVKVEPCRCRMARARSLPSARV